MLESINLIVGEDIAQGSQLQAYLYCAIVYPRGSYVLGCNLVF